MILVVTLTGRGVVPRYTTYIPFTNPNFVEWPCFWSRSSLTIYEVKLGSLIQHPRPEDVINCDDDEVLQP